MVEGLEVGRKLVALDRQRKPRSGLSRVVRCLWASSDGRSDYRCLTARYRIQSREAGLKTGCKRAARRSSNKADLSNTLMALLESVIVKGNHACLARLHGNRKVVRMVRFGTPLSASEEDKEVQTQYR